jgi:hypothetical protein
MRKRRSFANGNQPVVPGQPGLLGWEWEMTRETTIWDVGA